MDFQQRKNGPHIDDALKALGIDPTPRAKAGPNLPIGFLHAAETIHNGVKYSVRNQQDIHSFYRLNRMQRTTC